MLIAKAVIKPDISDPSQTRVGFKRNTSRLALHLNEAADLVWFGLVELVWLVELVEL